MKKRNLAFCLILIELIIQIAGSLYYDQMPAYLWTLADAILVLVPLAFGMKTGLLCLLPAAVSEIIWFCVLRTPGPLLHLASFALTVVFLGAANNWLRPVARLPRVLLSIALFILFLAAEEALYRGLMTLLLQRPMAWESVFGTVLSPVNLLLLPVLVFCCTGDSHSANKNFTDTHPINQ